MDEWTAIWGFSRADGLLRKNCGNTAAFISLLQESRMIKGRSAAKKSSTDQKLQLLHQLTN